MRLFKLEITYAIVILTLTFSIYIHLFFSQTSNEISFFGILFQHSLLTNEVFVWSFLNPLITILFLALFYLTSSFRWRILILPLVVFYCLEFLDVIVEAETSIDKFFGLKRLILPVLLIISLSWIDKVFFRKIVNKYSIVNLKDIFFINYGEKVYQKYHEKTTERNKGEISNLNFIKNLILLKKRLVELVNFDNEFLSNKGSRIHSFFFAILIILTPLFFVNELLPSGLSNLKLGSIEIESYGFVDVRSFAWYTKNKIILIASLSIWFVSSYSWWRYSLLVPLSIYLFQFWEAFQDIRFIEAYGNISTLPIVAIILLLILIFGNMARKKLFHFKLLEEIEKEIDQYIQTMVNIGDLRDNKTLNNLN